MKNIFLDTNIFLRYFTRDNEEMYQETENIFSLIEEGKLQPATSTIILIEIIYTLQSFYHQQKESIKKHIDSILKIKNLYLIEQTNFRKSYELFKTYNQKISDFLIISQIPQNYNLCSYDKKLEKIIGKKRFEHPKEIIKKKYAGS